MRLIDADAVVLQSRKDLYTYEADLVKNHLDLFPTIDAVPVVRCKDCKHSGEFRNWWGKGYTGCCHYPEEIHSVAPEHFCSYGERKDGDGK